MEATRRSGDSAVRLQSSPTLLASGKLSGICGIVCLRLRKMKLVQYLLLIHHLPPHNSPPPPLPLSSFPYLFLFSLSPTPHPLSSFSPSLLLSFSKAEDYGGLLLLASAAGNSSMVETLGSSAAEAGRNNIAFISYFILGKLDDCLEVLLQSNRFVGHSCCHMLNYTSLVCPFQIDRGCVFNRTYPFHRDAIYQTISN